MVDALGRGWAEEEGWTFFDGQEGGAYHHRQWGVVGAPGPRRESGDSAGFAAGVAAEAAFDRALFGARY